MHIIFTVRESKPAHYFRPHFSFFRQWLQVSVRRQSPRTRRALKHKFNFALLNNICQSRSIIGGREHYLSEPFKSAKLALAVQSVGFFEITCGRSSTQNQNLKQLASGIGVDAFATRKRTTKRDKTQQGKKIRGDSVQCALHHTFW